jgi:tRNA (guanine37-N1)-methyltransferase
LIFDVVTLFPGMFVGPLQQGVLTRARRRGAIGIRIHDLRRWGLGPHRKVDDASYGGGGGMVLKPEPIFEAVDWIRREYPAPGDRVVLLSPQGRRLEHASARRLAGVSRLILLCGRYEGVDERVREGLADEELSIGDVVLTGGELPALAVIDAVSRFIPGVLGREEAASADSFAEGKLDFPHFTRPARYRGMGVPEVLLEGDHGAIERWRARKALEATRTKRPDLLEEGRGGKARGKRTEGSHGCHS